MKTHLSKQMIWQQWGHWNDDDTLPPTYMDDMICLMYETITYMQIRILLYHLSYFWEITVVDEKYTFLTSRININTLRVYTL